MTAEGIQQLYRRLLHPDLWASPLWVLDNTQDEDDPNCYFWRRCFEGYWFWYGDGWVKYDP